MQISVTGKNLEITEAIRNYVNKKIGNLERYFRREGDWANVILWTERGQFLVEVSAGGGGSAIYAQARTEDMYASIDEVAEKLKKQIKKYKEKIKAEKQRQARSAIAEKRRSLEPPGLEMEEPLEEIVNRRMPFDKPMSVEEAKMQLDLTGNIFLVFYNAETYGVNVIYKMKDGRYGIFMR